MPLPTRAARGPRPGGSAPPECQGCRARPPASAWPRARPPLYAYSGGAWSPSGPLVTADGGPVHLTSVSCATASSCTATGQGRLRVFRWQLGTRGLRPPQQQAHLGFVRVGRLLRRRRLGRQRLHLLGELRTPVWRRYVETRIRTLELTRIARMPGHARLGHGIGRSNRPFSFVHVPLVDDRLRVV